MQLTPEDHIEGLTRLIASVESVERLMLFGSHARGTAAPRSDIDLAVTIASDRDWWALQEAVEEYPTLLKIDLVRLNAADDELAGEIMRTGKVLYERG